MKVAVFGIDPGDTTGIGAAHFELRPTLKATLLEGCVMRKSAEVTGTWKRQGKQIATSISRFLEVSQGAGIPLEDCHVVFEDFVLRMPAVTTNLGSVWVMAATVAYLDRDDVDVSYQQPSQKSFASNDRLHMWGFWEVGSEHKRDAWRHVILRVNALV